jgi:hypothetical protein
LFGKKTPKDTTVLIVDIENGSVGAALVRVSPGALPKLFSEMRHTLPLMRTFTANDLLAHTIRSLRDVLLHTSMTAARMRNHPSLAHVGQVDRVVVFAAPPWSTMKPGQEGLVSIIEPAFIEQVEQEIAGIFGEVPVGFYPTASAAMNATNILFEESPGLLLSLVGGEITELTMLQDGDLVARATAPTGKHDILRTLQTHAGFTTPEAHSALMLDRTTPIENSVGEALAAAAQHFAEHFTNAARDIHHATSVYGILVVANEPLGEWAAQQLAHSEQVGSLFGEGTSVQALHTHHLAPHLAAHAARPDLHFMIEALFVDDLMSGSIEEL